MASGRLCKTAGSSTSSPVSGLRLSPKSSALAITTGVGDAAGVGVNVAVGTAVGSAGASVGGGGSGVLVAAAAFSSASLLCAVGVGAVVETAVSSNDAIGSAGCDWHAVSQKKSATALSICCIWRFEIIMSLILLTVFFGANWLSGLID